MKENDDSNAAADKQEDLPHRARIPGFLLDQDVGLGTVVKRVTSTFGIKPCGGCEQRAARLNRWLVFADGRRK
jgi:hypothetical protein